MQDSLFLIWEFYRIRKTFLWPFDRVGKNLRALYHMISSLQYKGFTKIEFQPWTNLDKKVIVVPLICETNFDNFSTYTDNFQPQNLKNPLDH